MLRDLLGDGIFAADGEQWHWQRKTASNMFTARQEGYFSRIVLVTKQCCSFVDLAFVSTVSVRGSMSNIFPTSKNHVFS